MRVVKATLIKAITADGLMEVKDDILIGTTYSIDADSIRMEHGRNIVKNRDWFREIVTVAGSEEWFPTELLDIEGH